MRRSATIVLGCAAAALAAPVEASGPAWEAVTKIPGVFDIGGPRKDGWFVVAGAGRLYLVDPLGAVTPFAQGVGGYADDKGAEAYLAVSPGLQGPGGCGFAADDVYVLRLHNPLGVTKVDSKGHAMPFANVPGVKSLNGIAFDTVGAFGRRLLITGSAAGGTVVDAIDCAGAVQTITSAGPRVEGGLAVAPNGFGPFGGTLIAPDEISGTIYSIAADGTVKPVAFSGLPAGPDVGVEGLGFVPAGLLLGGGAAYYSDRATPGNPHPGTDSLLKLDASDLSGAGVQGDDLLAATEGGASMISVRCSVTCTVMSVVSKPTAAHGEGNLAFRVNPSTQTSPSPSPTTAVNPSPRPRSTPLSPAALIAAIVTLAVLGAGVLALVRQRWR